jgi:hypothetical protein
LRALADDHQQGVADVPLDVELGRVAVAAVDADGVEGELHGGGRTGAPLTGRKRDHTIIGMTGTWFDTTGPLRVPDRTGCERSGR